MFNIFEDKTPKQVDPVKKSYRLYDQHHGSFVLRNNGTGHYLHRQIDKKSRSITWTEVPLEYATQFKHFAIEKFIAEILSVKNSKITDVEHFMVVVKKGKIQIK